MEHKMIKTLLVTLPFGPTFKLLTYFAWRLVAHKYALYHLYLTALMIFQKFLQHLKIVQLLFFIRTCQ